MRNLSSVLLFLWLFLIGCTHDSGPAAGRFATGLTVVAVTDKDELIDAMSIAPDDAVREVIVRLPPGVAEMQVVLWGDHIDRSLPGDSYYTTIVKKRGGLGEVRADMKNGIAVAVDGNGFGAPFQALPNLENQVAQLLGAGHPLIEIKRR